MVKDPVCKMDIDEKTAKLKSDYNGKTYYFCSAGDKSSFDKKSFQVCEVTKPEGFSN